MHGDVPVAAGGDERLKHSRRSALRPIQLVGGLVMMGIGIAMQVRARLGLGPWDVLHQGISRHTGLAIGTVAILVGIPVLAAWWPLRQRPGVGTIANLVLIGLTLDVVLAHTSAPSGFGVRIPILLAGLGLQAFGTGVYLATELAAGPRDGLMTGLHARLGWSIGLARTVVESSVLVVGAALGGNIGVGTVVIAFGIGPLVQASLRAFGYETSRIPALGSRPGDAVGLSGE